MFGMKNYECWIWVTKLSTDVSYSSTDLQLMKTVTQFYFSAFSHYIVQLEAQIARFMGATWGPPGSWRPPDGPHVGPMNLAIRTANGYAPVFRPLFNLLCLSDAIRCWRCSSTSVQLIVCHLLGTKLLYEPVLIYCLLEHVEYISAQFESL